METACNCMDSFEALESPSGLSGFFLFLGFFSFFSPLFDVYERNPPGNVVAFSPSFFPYCRATSTLCAPGAGLPFPKCLLFSFSPPAAMGKVFFFWRALSFLFSLAQRAGLFSFSFSRAGRDVPDFFPPPHSGLAGWEWEEPRFPEESALLFLTEGQGAGVFRVFFRHGTEGTGTSPVLVFFSLFSRLASAQRPPLRR